MNIHRLRSLLARLRPAQRARPVGAATSDPIHDGSSELPPGAEDLLRSDNPRLIELRAEYQSLGWPVCEHSLWASADRRTTNEPGMFAELRRHDLRFFRGDTAYCWSYREDERASRLKYFIFLKYVLERDDRGLVKSLGEDGAFGSWVHRFDGYAPCSRDLLDSVNELYFLERQASIFSRTQLRILDIGAGYGRLAHRATQSLPGLVDYCCVDAVAESTFLSEYYLAFRKATPPARVATLPQVPKLESGAFDLAVNVHCFSECTRNAIAWWMRELARIRPPMLFIVPNDRQGFLSLEADGSRLDYLDLVTEAGYRLVIDENVFEDPAVGELLYIKDRFCLFESVA